MRESHKWIARGAFVLLGIAIASLPALCGHDARPREEEPAHPVVAPEPALCDASRAVLVVPVVPSALPSAVDAGPSCGSHPWCKVPLECCEADGSCCAS